VPGGLVADRFGGKWLCGGSILLSSIVSLLTPAAARIHIGLLIALRLLSGLGEGALVPAFYAMIARWSAPRCRSAVVSAFYAGANVGVVVGMLLTGVLCDGAGWPSAFYAFGAVGCVWSVAWSFLCYDSPPTHPRISAAELEYWERTVGRDDLVERPPTPWRRILTSVPVWALAVAFFANNWVYYTLVVCLPLYMHDVLGFDMTRCRRLLPSTYHIPFLKTKCGYFKINTKILAKLYCQTVKFCSARRMGGWTMRKHDGCKARATNGAEL